MNTTGYRSFIATVLTGLALVLLLSAPVLAGTEQIKKVVSGYSFSVALFTNGDLYAWGKNASGELGIGDTTDRANPTFVGSGYTDVAAGQSHVLAVMNDGTLWGWGSNASGQIKPGSSNYPSPVQIGSGYTAVMASSGTASSYASSYALKGSDLYAWGDNSYGQLGLGDNSDRTTPIFVDSGFTKVSAGFAHVLALKGSDLYIWGKNTDGEAGLGSYLEGAPTMTPTPYLFGTGYSDVAAGQYFSLALKSNGDLFGFGRNVEGAVGNGMTDGKDVYTPSLVGSGYSNIMANMSTSWGFKGGQPYVWGTSVSGQSGLGLAGASTYIYSPTPGPSGVSKIYPSSHYQHMALKSDGLYGWGGNNLIGDGNTSTFTRTSPVLILFGDFDNDGYGPEEDCNDTDPAINPGAIEIDGDGIDNNCDGIIDIPAVDADLDGYTSDVDCNDSDSNIYPGAPETIGDGIDSNCDGDDGVIIDNDNDGYPAGTDCNDNDPSIHPGATEINGDSVDQNCDGSNDETILSIMQARCMDLPARHICVITESF